MNKLSVIDIFSRAYDKLGSSYNIKAGFNGPYNDSETLCRNLCHWLIIISTLYKFKKEKHYKDDAYNIINTLNSKKLRPMNASFHFRLNPEKDFSNGLMGQAWVIEALIFAYKTFNDNTLLNLAIELYNMHSFDHERGLWRVLNVDGSYSSFDKTFNHQLWFAASASLIGNETVNRDVNKFIDNVLDKVNLYNDGIIFHKSSLFSFKKEVKYGFLGLSNYIIDTLFNLKSKKSLYSKSVGYHSFNLYAFTMLSDSFPELDFFNSKKFDSISKVLDNHGYYKALNKSNYSYKYNPPGFECAVFISYFLDDPEQKIIEHINKNIKVTGLFNDVNVHDTNTSFARLYELSRLRYPLDKKVFDVY